MKFIQTCLFLFTVTRLIAAPIQSEQFDFAYIDSEEAADFNAYVRDFPKEEYSIYSLHNGCKYYLDLIDDEIKNHLRNGSPWEQYMADYLKSYALKGSTVLDIGAHMGTHTIIMSRAVGPNGHVYAFEPQWKLFTELNHNLKLNRVRNTTTYHYALGESEEWVEMSQPAPRNEGGTPIGVGGDPVLLKRLDDLHFSNVSLIKIDVEGFEDAVLNGARETILSNRPIIFIEILGGWNYQTAPEHLKRRIEHTWSILYDMGYSVRQISYHDYFACPSEL